MPSYLSRVGEKVAEWTQIAPEARLKIIVVGAGLGGLAAAISCALGGHEVTVLESAKELAEVRSSHSIANTATKD